MTIRIRGLFPPTSLTAVCQLAGSDSIVWSKELNSESGLTADVPANTGIEVAIAAGARTPHRQRDLVVGVGACEIAEFDYGDLVTGTLRVQGLPREIVGGQTLVMSFVDAAGNGGDQISVRLDDNGEVVVGGSPGRVLRAHLVLSAHIALMSPTSGFTDFELVPGLTLLAPAEDLAIVSGFIRGGIAKPVLANVPGGILIGVDGIVAVPLRDGLSSFLLYTLDGHYGEWRAALFPRNTQVRVDLSAPTFQVKVIVTGISGEAAEVSLFGPDEVEHAVSWWNKKDPRHRVVQCEEGQALFVNLPPGTYSVRLQSLGARSPILARVEVGGRPLETVQIAYQKALKQVFDLSGMERIERYLGTRFGGIPIALDGVDLRRLVGEGCLFEATVWAVSAQGNQDGSVQIWHPGILHDKLPVSLLPDINGGPTRVVPLPDVRTFTLEVLGGRFGRLRVSRVGNSFKQDPSADGGFRLCGLDGSTVQLLVWERTNSGEVLRGVMDLTVDGRIAKYQYSIRGRDILMTMKGRARLASLEMVSRDSPARSPVKVREVAVRPEGQDYRIWVPEEIGLIRLSDRGEVCSLPVARDIDHMVFEMSK